MKFLKYVILILVGPMIFSHFSQAKVLEDDEQKVNLIIGAQTYLCEQANEQISCHAVGELQRKQVSIYKSGGYIGLKDKARNLTAEIVTSVVDTSVVYKATLCSRQTCSNSHVWTDPKGTVNQVMSGQYNITQKSFYILGFFLTTSGTLDNLNEKIIRKKLLLHKF